MSRNSNVFDQKTVKKLKYKSPLSPIGIDIGSARIKIVQLQQRAGRLSFFACKSSPTPAGTITGGRVSDPEKLSYKLGQLKQKLDLKDNRVNLCLGPDAHYLRIIELPPLSKKDLQKTLPWELEKHFPLKAAKAVYDCCPLNTGEAASDGSINYIFTAAETESANMLTGVAEKAGFKPISLEVSPLSLLRAEALKQNGSLSKNDLSSKALLDIGYRSSTLLLTGSGELKYCRHLRVGIFDFLKEVSIVNDINIPEAQRSIFQTRKLNTGTPIKIAELLLEQINSSIGYYLDQSVSDGIEPNSLIVSGGGAAIPGLISYLQSKLLITVEQHKLKSLTDSRSGASTLAPQINPALYATALGLALRGWLR
jgi:type IV pilus assembly protein PilM